MTASQIRAVLAERSGNSITITLAGRYANGYQVWYTVAIDGDGRFAAGYQTRGGRPVVPSEFVIWEAKALCGAEGGN
ncbi:hypothetical protein [uncultured Acetatifactor sp.]|uniref:hypothetical protein n=1 Tax=uncultured Acetatifactor sp. TaxID=1671927 RepID=UPI0026055A26|nr:hypothetical protein [uncultured Acetatifactor sp.]